MSKLENTLEDYGIEDQKYIDITHKVIGGAAKRLAKEAQNMEECPPYGIFAEPDEDDLFTWRARISGPIGTPYETGIF